MTLFRRLGLVARFLLATGALAAATSVEAAPVNGRGGALAEVRLPFVRNEGQVDPRVVYYAPTFAGTVFVTAGGELVYGLPAGTPAGRPRASAGPGWSLTETFVGGRPRPSGHERSESTVGYFLGQDQARWRPQVSTYEEVDLGQVWRGVSVAVRASGRNVEKVFTVAPGASVGRIRVGVRGARGLSVTAEGALVARTGAGDVMFTPPVAYQERDGLRHPVTVAYRARGKEYGFTVGEYDRRSPLVIDPLLQSTYLGGSGFDLINGIAISPATGDVYVVGETTSSNFPGTSGGAQPTFGAGQVDAFVARLNSALTSLIQATYLGGTGVDAGRGLAIHPTTGDVYVIGMTASSNFPGTAGGAQTTNAGAEDAFVARLDGTLTSLISATYLGGDNADYASAIAINAAGDGVYVAGSTGSPNFPGTAGGAQPLPGGSLDAFVARLSANLATLVQATHLGGSDFEDNVALAIHPGSGDVYVAGDTGSGDFPGTAGGAQPTNGFFGDGFVARLTSALTVLIQATYLGGDDTDVLRAIAIHPGSGDVYVAGYTFSEDFPGTGGGAQPTLQGGLDGIIARLPSSLTALTQATYLGGGNSDYILGLTIHPASGDVYVTGVTGSDDFPRVAGGAQPTMAAPLEAFVARLRNDLTTTALRQATFLGGTEFDGGHAVVAHPTTGDVYVAGETESTDFPRTAGGAQPTTLSNNTDGFVARLTASLVGVDAGPDVTLTKTHAGDFARGQAGATYTISVSNVGVVPTVGTVTVTDSLPAAFTATALGGPGWTCVLATLTCTRSDPLANGASYPDITLTVNVASVAPSAVINTATVSGGSDADSANNASSDTTTIVSFADVPSDYPLFPWIEALAEAGITGGCASSPQQFCPSDPVTRGQMAVFLLRGIHGAAFDPPAATGTVFADVPVSHVFAEWIERLSLEGITGGCATSPPRYCPDLVVTRGQMAVFLLRAKHGPGFVPPAASGSVFADVPAAHPFAAWIEELALEGITGGCGTDPEVYCPDAPVTRGQMAVFLVRAFGLPL